MDRNEPPSPYTNGNVLESGNSDDIEPVAEPKVSLSTKAFRLCAKAFRYASDLLRPAYFSGSADAKPCQPLRPTAWLDGLRGFAAFIVYMNHHQHWARGIRAHEILESGFGYQGRYYFAASPFFRTFFTGGHFAVAVFFVISGYVLSTKPLQLIQAGEYTRLGDNVGSALFRRWMRLYIPLMAVTLVFVTVCNLFGIWVEYVQWKGSFADELWSWYCEIKNFSFIYNTGPGEPAPSLPFHFHSWTIPLEFRGSVVIYTTLMAFSRCRKNARLLCELGLTSYFSCIVDGAYYSMFVAGLLLCDLDLLAAKGELPTWMTWLESHKKAIFYTLFVVSMYLSGVPSLDTNINKLAQMPGWYYLSLLKPQAVLDYTSFYLFVASVSLIAAIPRLPWLKAFLEIRFNQYLGHISYSLYLVHGPVLWTIGDRLYCAVGYTRKTQFLPLQGWIDAFPLSKAGPLGFEPAILLPQLILIPLTFWVAEVVTKVFDENSVKFARWVYKMTLEVPVIEA